jgi:hypothetical protein
VYNIWNKLSKPIKDGSILPEKLTRYSTSTSNKEKETKSAAVEKEAMVEPDSKGDDVEQINLLPSQSPLSNVDEYSYARARAMRSNEKDADTSIEELAQHLSFGEQTGGAPKKKPSEEKKKESEEYCTFKATAEQLSGLNDRTEVFEGTPDGKWAPIGPNQMIAGGLYTTRDPKTGIAWGRRMKASDYGKDAIDDWKLRQEAEERAAKEASKKKKASAAAKTSASQPTASTSTGCKITRFSTKKTTSASQPTASTSRMTTRTRSTVQKEGRSTSRVAKSASVDDDEVVIIERKQGDPYDYDYPGMHFLAEVSMTEGDEEYVPEPQEVYLLGDEDFPTETRGRNKASTRSRTNTTANRRRGSPIPRGKRGKGANRARSTSAGSTRAQRGRTSRSTSAGSTRGQRGRTSRSTSAGTRGKAATQTKATTGIQRGKKNEESPNK